MNTLIANLTGFLEWAQKPSLIVGAIMVLIAGYFWLTGGQDGRRIAKGLLIGVAVGLILINGALGLATEFNSNITF